MQHSHTTTFTSALRVDRIQAPWLLDGPMNGEGFRTYIEHQLVSTLKPRDIVIADNLGSHKNKTARAAIRKVGARLILPPKYLPDLNPIEQVFAKLKHLLRKAAARSRHAVSNTVAGLLRSYIPDECKNYLRTSGYGPT